MTSMATSASLLPPTLLLLAVQLWACVWGARDSYIIHMDASSMPRAFSNHQHWYSSLLSSESFSNIDGNRDAPPPTLIYSYHTAIHGFSAVLSKSQFELLKGTPGFISGHPEGRGTKATTHSYKYLGLDPVTGIWPASKYGEDIIIGVLDTGVWPESRSFADNGMPEVPKRWKGRCDPGTAFNVSMCNKKLIGARYFNKGVLAADPNATISMNSPRDTDGHGTHVASIAAGNYVAGASYFGYGAGTARGIAPRARIAVYKVIWEQGIYHSDFVAAMDQAIADGVDVISLSLSFGQDNIYEDPLYIASFAAMERGILVSAAAGNSANPGYGTIRNGAPWVLTVGATDIDRRFSSVVSLGNGLSFVGISLYIGNKSVKNLPLYYNETSATCNSVNELKDKARGKVVVCEYDGDPSLAETLSQTSVVKEAKGAGALLLTTFELDNVLQKGYECPAAALNGSDSTTIKEYIRSSKRPTVSMTFRKTITGIKPAPTRAFFSKMGPASGTSTIIKPDSVAPGVLILAAFPPKSEVITLQGKPVFSNFTLLSGTSMACPHASGLAALLKSVHPDWSASAIRSAIMTTATVVNNDGGNMFDGSSPLSLGSGEINPNRAMDPGLVYDAGHQDYVKFLCALNFTREQFHTIARNSSSYDQCKRGTGGGIDLDLNYPSFGMLVEYGQRSGVKKFKRTVTNVGAEQDGLPVTYRANLTRIGRSPQNDFLRVSVVPQKLVFQRRNQKASFTLTIQVIKPVAGGVHWGFLAWVDDRKKHVVRTPIAVFQENM